MKPKCGRLHSTFRIPNDFVKFENYFFLPFDDDRQILYGFLLQVFLTEICNYLNINYCIYSLINYNDITLTRAGANAGKNFRRGF